MSKPIFEIKGLKLSRITIFVISILNLYLFTYGYSSDLYNNNWEYSWNSKAGPWLPYLDSKISLKNQHEFLWLRKKLNSEQIKNGYGLNIRIKTFFEAYINENKIYDYFNNGKIENIRGGVRHLVPLGTPRSNSYLYLKVASAGDKVGLEGNIYSDKYDLLIKEIISKDAMRLILGIVFCIFSIIILAIYIFTREMILLQISGFGINMGIWTLSFCHKITQEVFLGGSRFFDYAIYWSSYLAPIFILWFIANLRTIRFKKLLLFARNIFILFSLISIVASLFSIFSLRSVNYYFNLLLIPTGLLILLTTIASAFKGGKEALTILVGILFVGAFTLIDSLSYTDIMQKQLQSEVPQSHWGMFTDRKSVV